MLHYYFLKYWSRGLVGLMIAMVIGYVGIFSYSLSASQKGQDQASMESAQLSAAPQQDAYEKSLKVFEGIQDLKIKNQDTTKLESKYADSVKNLSSNNQKEASSQLNELASEIAKMNDSMSPTPQPSGTIAIISATPSISPSVTGGATATASAATEAN